MLRSSKWIVLIVFIAVIGIGLVLDLQARGAIWRSLYNVTGEESTGSQLYGFLNYLGNLTRRQPNAHTNIATNYPINNPVGANTFLDLEVEPAKRERTMQMLSEAGVGWIRQQFRWADIEITERGQFIDDRNDINGDGTKDAIDAWEKYDQIVDLVEKYHINVIARINDVPAWAQPAGAMPSYAPPADFQDFANFAGELAKRYKGRIHYYQVWNEPNIYPEWGEQAVDPVAYTDLLCRAYKAIKAADPNAAVISGALAPTVELSERNLNDLVFLQRMYDNDASSCFDILGAQGYGLFSGPTDQRMRITTINFGHVLWLRDMMVANKDGHKPIWIGEMAWNPVPNDPTIRDRERYGIVTDKQAAQYAIEGYERARKEWPFVGVISYWYFKRPSDTEKQQSFYYFRMVEPDFTPRPVYEAIKQYTADHYPASK